MPFHRISCSGILAVAMGLVLLWGGSVAIGIALVNKKHAPTSGTMVFVLVFDSLMTTGILVGLRRNYRPRRPRAAEDNVEQQQQPSHPSLIAPEETVILEGVTAEEPQPEPKAAGNEPKEEENPNVLEEQANTSMVSSVFTYHSSLQPTVEEVVDEYDLSLSAEDTFASYIRRHTIQTSFFAAGGANRPSERSPASDQDGRTRSF